MEEVSYFSFFKQKIIKDRLLRSNLLQPLNDVQTINTRLDVVDELIRKRDLIPEFKKSYFF